MLARYSSIHDFDVVDSSVVVNFEYDMFWVWLTLQKMEMMAELTVPRLVMGSRDKSALLSAVWVVVR